MIHLARQTGTAPRLAFVNALGTELEIWDEVVERLPAAAEILRYDIRGHRRSPGPPADMAGHADDLGAFLEGPTILCGLSIGGQIAMQTALRHPSKVSALILVATDARIGTPGYYADRIERIRAEGMAPFAWDQVQRWFPPAFVKAAPEVVERARATLAAQSVDGYAAACKALEDCDLSSRLDRIDVPTLCLTGSEDVSIPPERIVALAARIRTAEAAILPGVGHLPCLEDPATLVGHIERMTAQVG